MKCEDLMQFRAQMRIDEARYMQLLAAFQFGALQTARAYNVYVFKI